MSWAIHQQLKEFPEEHRGACRPLMTEEPTMEDFHSFLNFLRSTGQINMVGAVPYVMHYMDVDEQTARDAWSNWISFDNNQAALEALITGK